MIFKRARQRPASAEGHESDPVAAIVAREFLACIIGAAVEYIQLPVAAASIGLWGSIAVTYRGNGAGVGQWAYIDRLVAFFRGEVVEYMVLLVIAAGEVNPQPVDLALREALVDYFDLAEMRVGDLRE